MNTFSLNYDCIEANMCLQITFLGGGQIGLQISYSDIHSLCLIFKYSQKLFHVNVLLKFVKSEMFSILSSIINYRSIRR